MQDSDWTNTIVLKADLCSNNAVKYAFHFCATPTNFKDHTFCLIKQDKMYWGPLPTLTRALAEILKVNAKIFKDLDLAFVSTSFKKTRNIVFLQLNLDIFVVNTSYVLTLLKSKVTRRLLNGSLVVRKVEMDVLISLLYFAKTDDEPTGRNNAGGMPTCRTIHNSNRMENKNAMNSKYDFRSSVIHLIPRPEHSTKTVEYCKNTVITKRNNSMLLTGAVNKRTILVYPLHTQEHNKPKYSQDQENVQRDGHETRPVQATEIDAGQLSIGAYNSPDRTSMLSTQNFQLERQNTSPEHFVVSGTGLGHHAKPARYPEYMTKEERLSTFYTAQWSASKPNRDVLAEWGFFFTGNQDLVRCYQCGIGLKDWIKEDDVMTEHVKHSSACHHLLNRLGKEKVDQIKIALANPGTANSIQLPYKIRSPRFQTMESRVSSFQNFPEHVQISHQELAVSGLFFTGNGDLCRCFTCDGGLKDWSTGDDPIKEHATYFPHCTYINQLKGSDYVEALQRSRFNRHTMGATGGNNNTVQETHTVDDLPLQNLAIQNFSVSEVVQKLGYADKDVVYAKNVLARKGKLNPTAEEIVNAILDMQEKNEMVQHAEADITKESSEKDIKAIAEENTRLSQMVHCMLCVIGEADILFLPCAHHRICYKCSVDVTRCPVCDRIIQEKVKTFRS